MATFKHILDVINPTLTILLLFACADRIRHAVSMSLCDPYKIGYVWVYEFFFSALSISLNVIAVLFIVEYYLGFELNFYCRIGSVLLLFPQCYTMSGLMVASWDLREEFQQIQFFGTTYKYYKE